MLNGMSRILGGVVAGTILPFLAWSDQSAAVDSSVASSDEPAIEEIVVTAQRRSQGEMHVPISVSAFTGESLEAAGVTDTQSLQLVTPGLVVGSAAAYAQTYIRGIGNDSTTPGTESSVATYVDGVYRSQLVSGLQTFVNLERIEVLKGPQGTLYGRNALGGAINIVTRDVSRDSYDIDSSITVGNYDRIEGSGYLSGPISSTTAFSLSVMKVKSDGYIRNLYNGDELGATDFYSLEGKLVFDFSDTSHITLILDRFSRNDTSNVAFGQQSPLPLAATLPQATTLAQAFPAGSPQQGLLLAANDRPALYTGAPWQVYNNTPDYNKITDEGAAIKFIHETDPFQFTSISSYRYLDWDGQVDIDGSNRPIFAFAANDQIGKTFTQDFQFTSSEADHPALHWVAGAMYVSDHSGYENFRQFFPILGVLSGGVPEVQIDGEIETHAGAIYGQATYAWTDRFRTTLGARVSTEEKELLKTNTVIPLADLTIPTAGVPSSKRWSAVTPKVSAEYDFMPELLGYVSIDQGFKSGTYNTTQTSGVVTPVDPEKITAYQAGAKGTFLDRRLALEAASFYYDYKNLQTQVVDPTTGVTSLENAATAKLYGIDLTARSAITRSLNASLGASFLHATYTRFVGLAEVPDLVAGGNESESKDFSGNQLPRAPHYTLTSEVSYDVPVQADVLRFIVNGNYSDKFYFDADNRLKQNAYGQLNARMIYALHNGFEVSIWGKNLTDTSYLTTVQSNAIGDAVQWNEKRTYGLTFRYKFLGAH